MYKLQRPQYSKINNINHFGFILPNYRIYDRINGMLQAIPCHMVYSRYQEHPILVNCEDIKVIPIGWVEISIFDINTVTKNWWINPKEISFCTPREDESVEIWCGYNTIYTSLREYLKLFGQDKNIIDLNKVKGK